MKNEEADALLDEAVAIDPEPLRRLTRDIRNAAKTLTDAQARFLVDSYYVMQRDRIRAAHQTRTLQQTEPVPEPHEVVDWLSAQTATLETSIKSVLQVYARHHPVGNWALSIVGIGPVIAAGLLAHINLEPWRCKNPKRPLKVKCFEGQPCTPQCGTEISHTVGHIWRFAGLDPTVKWEKGQRRPWNGQLKRLCWLIGESFTKNQNRDGDFYGKFYVSRKAIEEAKNSQKLFADQAKVSLEQKRWARETATRGYYEQGLLPPARIHLRAQRYAVKLFLSHYHHVAYYHRYQKHPPRPYVIEHLGHTDLIQVPNWPFTP